LSLIATPNVQKDLVFANFKINKEQKMLFKKWTELRWMDDHCVLTGQTASRFKSKIGKKGEKIVTKW